MKATAWKGGGNRWRYSNKPIRKLGSFTQQESDWKVETVVVKYIFMIRRTFLDAL